MEDVAFLAVIAAILTVISAGLAHIAWQRSRREFRKPFALLMLSEAIIAWAYLLDAASPDLATKLWWNNIEYIGYLAALPLFFIFAVQFSGDVKLGRRAMAAVAVPAAAFYILLVTNPYHRLFYVSTQISDDFYRSFDAVYGPAFIAYAIYAVALLTAGMAALVLHYLQVSRAHRYRVGITCMACGLQVMVVTLNYLQIHAIPGCLLVSLGFLVSDVLLFIGSFGFELFSMIPYAVDRAVSTMKGMLMVLDDRNNIVYHNCSVESLVDGRTIDDEKIDQVFPRFPMERLNGNDEPLKSMEEEINELLPGRFFIIRVHPVADHDGYIIGRNITLREITAQVRAEKDARQAREMLELMNSITRHDVLNQLTILEGHTSLADMKTDALEVKKHLNSISQAAQNIKEQLTFAKDYQDMGQRPPEWLDVGRSIQRIEGAVNLGNIHIVHDVIGLELLADRLLEKVLYNLVDNSIVHGGGLTQITITSREREGGLDLTYCDDGQGIPGSIRPNLFTKGCGRRTGLGLYLSKEILNRSGMTITEAGEPGKGVRFIIGVPAGRYRFSSRTYDPIKDPSDVNELPACAPSGARP